MTEFKNRNGESDYYDERVIEDIMQSCDQYVKMHGTMPSSVGVNDYEMKEVRKAREAGAPLTVVCKGRTYTVPIGCASKYFSKNAIKKIEPPKKAVRATWN